MAHQDIRQTLLEAQAEISQAIRASEEWHPSYKADPGLFRALLSAETQLEQCVAQYLVALSLRAPRYVDWSQVPEPLHITAASSPLANKTDEVWKAEMLDFNKAVVDAITALIALGGQAGEIEYGVTLGIHELSESVLKAAREQTAELVSGITDTNRTLIQEAIKRGVDRGESTAEITNRIRLVINNPQRAEMIAQTESVNAYQRGLRNFADQTGAVSKTWQALAGACVVCSPLDEKTIDIDKKFQLPNGREVSQPTGHPRCRCGVRYNY